MEITASKNPFAKGSERASAWMGKTRSASPASVIRWRFSEALHHRSVAQTCTPTTRARKIDDVARPQPRSRTRMPGLRSRSAVSHSVSHNGFAPPLTLARTQSGLYFDARGNLGAASLRSAVIEVSSGGRNARDRHADPKRVHLYFLTSLGYFNRTGPGHLFRGCPRCKFDVSNHFEPAHQPDGLANRGVKRAFRAQQNAAHDLTNQAVED